MNVRSTLQPLKINGPKLEYSSNSVRVLVELCGCPRQWVRQWPILKILLLGRADLYEQPMIATPSLEACLSSYAQLLFLDILSLVTLSSWLYFPATHVPNLAFLLSKKKHLVSCYKSKVKENCGIFRSSLELDASIKSHATPCSYASFLSFLVISCLVRIIPICCRWSRIVAVQMKYVSLWVYILSSSALASRWFHGLGFEGSVMLWADLRVVNHGDRSCRCTSGYGSCLLQALSLLLCRILHFRLRVALHLVSTFFSNEILLPHLPYKHA